MYIRRAYSQDGSYRREMALLKDLRITINELEPTHRRIKQEFFISIEDAEMRWNELMERDKSWKEEV